MAERKKGPATESTIEGPSLKKVMNSFRVT